MSAPILVTGAAGFIGSHVAHRLIDRGESVIGVDNLNAYYDPNLKLARLARLEARPGFSLETLDVADRAGMEALFAKHRFPRVVHLAAQAGVRYSLENPYAYVTSNVVGFQNILEGCRHHGCRHLVYASSSSVYGANTILPSSEHAPVDHPLTIYAASKKANELFAHAYSNLFALPTTGLRFFSVYGPWGRPDMALFIFAKRILEGEPIEVFNHGRHTRDFTYIDDIAEGVVRVLDRIPDGDPDWSGASPDPATSRSPWRIYNIGSGSPVELLRYIELIEECLGRKAKILMRPARPEDVADTTASCDDLERDVGYRPNTPVEVGVARFIEWYRDFYGV